MMEAASGGTLEETVYGGDMESPSTEEQQIVSDRVHNLANSIYQEFESMITQYGQDVVQNLMPLVVSILETMDRLYTDKHDRDIELELLKEDNMQLMKEYDREKQMRKSVDEKILKMEDTFEEEKKELSSKMESIESIVRMLELKAKNANDHVSRLEEKESEMKRDYHKLHERYTELFRNHMDYMERARLMQSGGSGLVDSGKYIASTGAHGRPVMTSVRASKHQGAVLDPGTPEVVEDADVTGRLHTGSPTLRDEMKVTEKQRLMADIVQSTPELELDFERQLGKTSPLDRHTINYDATSGGSAFDEMTMPDADAASDDGENPPEDQDFDSEFGMSREIENLIKENTELIETKNALNIVKDDLITKVDDLTGENEMLREEINSINTVKASMKLRISALEQDLREVKVQFEDFKKKKEEHEEDDESVPMSQRKRFTRIEMARVLMERNQYKERLMELQEAVRWTEMMRASKEHPDILPKKRNSVWNMFSSLFGSSGRPPRHRDSQGQVKFVSGPGHAVASGACLVRPYGDPNRRLRDALGLPEDKARAYDFLQSDNPARIDAAGTSTTSRSRDRSWMRRDTGRVQAYGWSLPAKVSLPARVPIPVPVYCRPLVEKTPGMKGYVYNQDSMYDHQLWCAAGVNLSGARTRSGDSVVGTSVFYKCPQAVQRVIESQTDTSEEVGQLDKEIQEKQSLVQSSFNLPPGMSSLVWICSSAQGHSQVIVIDANQPAEYIDSFYLTHSHALCVYSVPGASESDYEDQSDDVTEGDRPIPGEQESEGKTKQYDVRHVQCSPDDTEVPSEREGGQPVEMQVMGEGASASIGYTELTRRSVSYSSPPDLGTISEHELLSAADPMHRNPSEVAANSIEESGEGSAEDTNSTILTPTSLQPTMWIGCQSGHLFVHSAVANWRRCLHAVKLKDSVLNIVHMFGRVLIALADGSLIMFRRASSGEWDLSSYWRLQLGGPHHSVRCLAAVPAERALWAGFRNRIFVIDAGTLDVKTSFEAHPRPESQVRQLCYVGEGVWVSIRLDSTLRLYHASTYQHLQDLDIEPCVTRLIDSSKLGLSLIRITYLMASCDRLWVGTGNGIIASIPFSSAADQSSTDNANAETDAACLSNTAPLVPTMDVSQAQLSFHGHRDAIKFFVSVPGKPPRGEPKPRSSSAPARGQVSTPSSPRRGPDTVLVLSGGEGYLDFRIGPEDDEDRGEKKGTSRDRSHLIVWQIQRP